MRRNSQGPKQYEPVEHDTFQFVIVGKTEEGKDLYDDRYLGKKIYWEEKRNPKAFDIYRFDKNALCNELNDYLIENNFHGFGLLIYPGEIGPVIVAEFSGDWKHEHGYFKDLITQFFNEKYDVDVAIRERWADSSGGSDGYRAGYNIFVGWDDYMVDGAKRMFAPVGSKNTKTKRFNLFGRRKRRCH